MKNPEEPNQTITPSSDNNIQITNQVVSIPHNSLGTAGFVLALIGVFTSWIPVLGWLIWLIGAILSVVGLFRTPKGMAIAGTVISFFDFILLVTVVGTIAALFH